eukprot:SAG31_NODE_12223_length_957_cov_3.039627_2_plen_38_part_01
MPVLSGTIESGTIILHTVRRGIPRVGMPILVYTSVPTF